MDDRYRVVKNVPSCFKHVDNFLGGLEAKGEKGFFVDRTFSLGDVLMLVPAVREVRRLGYNVVVRTVDPYLDVLKRLGVYAVPTFTPIKSHTGIKFDWVVELDHVEPTLREYHRTLLYMNAMGVEELPETVDWSAKLENFEPLKFDTPDFFVVIQGRGANNRKQLPAETIAKLVEKFNDVGAFVYYIGEPSGQKFVGDLVKNLGFSLKLPELFTLIAKAKLLVCMDSGPLWVSHFMKTPVAVMLGPTGARQRLSLHPFYPDGAIAVELNKLFGCDICYERIDRCAGRVDCLNHNSEKVADYTIKKIVNFLFEGK